MLTRLLSPGIMHNSVLSTAK